NPATPTISTAPSPNPRLVLDQAVGLRPEPDRRRGVGFESRHSDHFNRTVTEAAIERILLRAFVAMWYRFLMIGAAQRFALAFLLVLVAMAPASAQCMGQDGVCRGCGCKGGPGYREIATGRCVGFRQLSKKCGNPPSPTLCVFENAPGTGANRECALGKRQKNGSKPSEKSAE
ncbi:MAG TPA: hypothetical protein PLE50_01295, partial [Rhabdaerophilum sp.]|nr:hypothetical protein [Rhabdaerophilum sp.]